MCSVVSDSETPWTVALQAPLPMGFLRQEYWSALPFHSPGDLPNTGIKPVSPALQADCLLLSYLGSPLQGSVCRFKDFVVEPTWSEMIPISWVNLEVNLHLLS